MKKRLTSARSSGADFNAISEIVHEELDTAVLFLVTSQVLVMNPPEAQDQTARLAFLQPWMKMHVQPDTLRSMALRVLSRQAREALHVSITDQVIRSHPNMKADKNMQDLRADLHELSDKWFAGITGRVSWYVASNGVDISRCLPLGAVSDSDPLGASVSMRLTRPLVSGELSFSPEFVACVTSLIDFLKEVGEDQQLQTQTQAQQSYVYVYAMWFFMLRCAGACFEFDSGSWVVGPHKRALSWMELYASENLDLIVEGQPVLHYLTCSRCASLDSSAEEDSTCLEEVCVILAIATQLLHVDPRSRGENQPRLSATQTLLDWSVFAPPQYDEEQLVTRTLDQLSATVLLLWLVRISPIVLDVARERETETGAVTVVTLLSELLQSPRISRACLGLLMQASNNDAKADSSISILPALVGLSAVPAVPASAPAPQPVVSKIVPNISSMQKELAELKQMQKNMGNIIVALNEKVQKSMK